MSDPQVAGRTSGFRAARRDLVHVYQRMSDEALDQRARRAHARYYADPATQKFVASWRFAYGLQRGTMETLAAVNTMATKVLTGVASMLDTLTFSVGKLRAVDGVVIQRSQPLAEGYVALE